MASQINLLFYIYGKIRVRTIQDSHCPICNPFTQRIIFKLVHISSGLEAKMFKNIKCGILTEKRKCKFLCLLYHLTGIICFVYCDTDHQRV